MKAEPDTPARPTGKRDARERLLKAALHAFSSLGFEAVGPRMLGEMAGVNHSLVAYHFGSMDGLWREAVASLFVAYRERLDARLGGLDGLDAATQLSVGIEDLVAFSRDNPELHRIMTIEGRRGSPRLDWLIENQIGPLFARATALIRQGQADGTVRPFDPALLFYAMIGLAATPFSVSVEFERVTGGNPAQDGIVRELGRMIRFLVLTGRETPVRSSGTLPRRQGKA